MKGYCLVCGEEVEVRMCCNRLDCGCMGLPIDPPICSNECYDKWLAERKTKSQGIDELADALDRVGGMGPEEVWESVKPKLSDKSLGKPVIMGSTPGNILDCT